MTKTPAPSPSSRSDAGAPPAAVEFLGESAAAKARYPYVHIYHNGAVCETDKVGHAMPEERSTLEIVVDATEGFIPLWARDVTLRWRFNEASMTAFRRPDEAKAYIRQLFGEAVKLWGLDNIPVRFTEAADAWDFEFKVSTQPSCTPTGCTLARAFFPDGGQHDIMLYPTLFSQSRVEQVETLAHEIGHVFGLRHFFAKVSEAGSASEIFGKHDPHSIMNYGPKSEMTAADRRDLKKLYAGVWSGQIRAINGTPVRLLQPFSALRVPTPRAVAFAV